MVFRETEEQHNLYESEDAGQDGGDDGQDQGGDHHAPGGKNLLSIQVKTFYRLLDIANVCLVPVPCLCHGTTDSKAARNKPRDRGEESEGGITGHQQLGQVDQESHRSTKYVADP